MLDFSTKCKDGGSLRFVICLRQHSIQRHTTGSIYQKLLKDTWEVVAARLKDHPGRPPLPLLLDEFPDD